MKGTLGIEKRFPLPNPCQKVILLHHLYAAVRSGGYKWVAELVSEDAGLEF
jgi:hypothetical protein